MEAIFSSKLYIASNKKEKIRAALADPMNQELVQQLRSYLDPEYQKADILEPEDNPAETEDVQDGEGSVEEVVDSPVDDGKHSRPTSGHVLSGFKKKFDGEVTGEPVNDGPSSDEPGGDNLIKDVPSVSEDGEVEESKIVSTTLVEPIAIDTDSLKGLLNSVSDTQGVQRILIKENNELWIYYEDKYNLNNVMSPVLDRLNSAGYSTLEFNRLARTDNAIVFIILASSKEMEPVGEGDE